MCKHVLTVSLLSDMLSLRVPADSAGASRSSPSSDARAEDELRAAARCVLGTTWDTLYRLGFVKTSRMIATITILS